MAKVEENPDYCYVVAAVLAPLLESWLFDSYYYLHVVKVAAATKQQLQEVIFKDSRNTWSDTKEISEVSYTTLKHCFIKRTTLPGERGARWTSVLGFSCESWRIPNVDATVNTADWNVTINGVTTDGNNYTAKLNHLYPGTLTILGF